MALDPSIILGAGKGVTPIEGPLDAYSKASTVANAIQSNQMNRMKMDEYQRGLDQQSKVRELLQGSDPSNPDATYAAILKSGDIAGAGAFQKQNLENKKSAADTKHVGAQTDKIGLENSYLKISHMSSMLSEAKDPASYATILQNIQSNPLYGDVAQRLPQNYDPAQIQTIIAQGQTLQQKIEAKLKADQMDVTKRGQDMTYGSSMYGHQVAQQGQQIHADTEARKLDPLGINQPLSAPASPGALPPTPGGMPVNPGGGFKGDRNAPELPAMRTAMAGPYAPGVPEPPGTQADLVAAQRGLTNAKTPAARAGFQDAIASIQADLAKGGAAQSGGVMPVSMPAQAPGALVQPGAAPAVPAAMPASGTLAQPTAPAVPRGPIDMSLTGDDFLKQLPPEIANRVKAYATGRMAFPAGAAMRAPIMDQYLKLVAAYDPEFDATDYNKRNKTAAGFATGKQGDAVKSINQAINHAGSLYDTIDKLNNSNLPGANLALTPMVNAFERHVLNDPTQGEFKTNATALASELRKVFAGSGGGNLTELKQWEESLPLNESKKQQQAYLKKGIELLNGGIEALNDQYKSGFGQKANILQNDSLIKPKARAILSRITGEGAPAASGGNADLHAKAQAILNGNR